MTLPEPVRRLFQTPALTRARVLSALGVAVFADGLQWLLAPLAVAGFFLDEIIDVVAMILTTRLLGFHPLLLPTFVVELVPLVGMLPTWTGCVAAVIALRKRASALPINPPPSSNAPAGSKPPPVIDV